MEGGANSILQTGGGGILWWFFLSSDIFNFKKMGGDWKIPCIVSNRQLFRQVGLHL